MFVDVANLPKNVSDGPETWGEAWSKLGGAGDDVQALIENTTADGASLEAAYDRRIRQIEQLTGQRLANPLRVSSEGMAARDAELVRLQAGQGGIGGASGADLMPGYREAQEADFNSRASALAERYPQVNSVLLTSMEEEKHRVMREAEEMLDRAANSPELGMLGRFSAQLVGGLRGAARDPAQWGMAVFGAPGAAAKTVAGRFGQVMLQEFALNAGQEAFLQAASQERKRAAGLDHGLADAMKNVGIAGTFGALFGGSVQAGAEIARVLNLGEGGAERAARVLDGRPEPGDLEAVAAATGRTLEPDETAMIARSFEERTLDEMMIPNDPTPEDVTLMSAAVRHADDPDNFPAPDLVERALADSADGPSRTLSADEYQRIYDGDEAAIDAYQAQVAAEGIDIADTFTTERSATPRDARSDAFKAWFGDSHVVDEAGAPLVVFRGEERLNDDVGLWFTRDTDTASAYAEQLSGGFGDGANVTPAYISMRRPLEIDAGGRRYDALEFEGSSTNTEQLLRLAADRGADGLVIRNVLDGSSKPVDVYRPIASMQVKSIFDLEFKAKTGFGPRVLDPIRDQKIRPDDVAEPFDDASMARAERLAGDIVPARSDRAVDLLPFEDGNGNRAPINIAEALAIADEPAFHADLLEACKL